MSINLYDVAKSLEQEMIERRRDFHKYPEAAWTEFRTASIVADTLTELGFEVYTADEALLESEMMGVPSAEELKKHQERAIADGANPKWVERMTGGKTGVLAVMKFAKPGKTVAFRVDMDANDVDETNDPNHLPNKEGFASQYKNVMHACGHDAHTTMGLALAKMIATYKELFAGTIKIIFQCAEEGVRGGRAMAAKGIVDDVDYFFGMHIGNGRNYANSVTCMIGNFLATSKIDAYFKGVSAHAGAAPQDGKNALLAAAQSCISLHSIARHGKGASRINVGVFNAGTGRNVLPDVATIKFETRGATTDINNYMETEAYRMIESAAKLYNVEVEFKAMGAAPSCKLDRALGEEAYKILSAVGKFDEVVPEGSLGGSEDVAYFMERIQERGGQAIFMYSGAKTSAGLHNSKFYMIDEGATMVAGAAAMAILAQAFSNK